MRTRIALLALLALAACVSEAAPPRSASPQPQPVCPVCAPAGPHCLSIVAWNDLHGQISPEKPLLDTGGVLAGGVVALADQLSAIRATGSTVVVLDGGDQFTGPLVSSMAEGAPIVEALGLLGVDATVIGNHDFDFGPVGSDKVSAPFGVGDEAGPNGPRGALLQRMTQASYPFLSANIRKSGGAPTAWPKLKAWVMIERGGFKIGVVGYTTRDTPSATLKPNVADLDFSTDAATHVAAAIRAARAAGASPVVLLAHASIDGDLPTSLEDGETHQGELAKLAVDLGPDKPDLIVGGHRHVWMLGRVSGVPIVSSDWHGVGLSRSEFCSSDGGPPRLVGIDRRVAMAASPPLSPLGAQVAAAMTPWEQKVKVIADASVGTLPRICQPKAPEGTAFADQAARAQAETVAATSPPAGVPVVGLANIGLLRSSIGPGAVTFNDVFAVLPFEDTVATCGTTRAGLTRVLQNALKKDTARDRFPLGVWGAKVTIRRAADRTPSLVSVRIEGQPTGADDAPVWLALNDFILFGGDDLLVGVTCTPSATSQIGLRDAWRHVLEREKRCDGASTNILLQP